MRKYVFILLILGLLSGLLSGLFFVSEAWANLERSTISNVGVSLYGVFMTSDPNCQVGLIASVPLSLMPTISNFVSAPVLGAGPVPKRLACVVLLVANQVQVTWQAGAYQAPDNVCNAGGTTNVNPCVSTAITWPLTISQSAQAMGLSLSNSCGTTPTGSEIVPIFMSINSSCTGNSVIDAQTAGCTIAGKTTSSVSQAPSSINSSSSGARIQATAVSGRIVFAVDPERIISGQSGACKSASVPVFSIHR